LLNPAYRAARLGRNRRHWDRTPVTIYSPTSQNVGRQSLSGTVRPTDVRKVLTGMRETSQSTVSADWLRALERTAQAVRTQDRTFGQILDELAATHSDRPALIGENATLSFRSLAARANRYARWALAQGVNKGDCVALLMPNCPDYFAIWSGISRVGGVVALVNTNLSGQALAHCLDIVRPHHVIVAVALMDAYRSAAPFLRAPAKLWVDRSATGDGAPLGEAIDALDEAPLTQAEQRPVRLSDRALYIYTSGTTGLPKAANVSHRRVVEWSAWFSGLMDTQPDDRMYNCLPLYHSVGGIVAIGSVLVTGGSVVIREKFSASRFWNDVAETKSTLFQYIGELCRYLLNAPPNACETAHRLRICCGNGLRADIWDTFKTRFKIPRILEFYAATEGSFSLYNVEGKPGAIGRLPGFMTHRSPVAIVKHDVETGTAARNESGLCIPCGVDEAGEAIGRLPQSDKPEASRFEGYTNESESERKVLRDVIAVGDSWFRTGDLMKRDKAGYFYFVDRIGDTFRWKGENVSTLEVANVIAGSPGVVEATIYGVAVPGFDGRAGMAGLVVSGEFDPATLHAFVAKNLAPYARPLFIRIMDKVATTETFKQKKQQLIADGFDPSVITDTLYADDAKHGAYVPLTADYYARLIKPSAR
jgi:fatty-acyl-CoA synthase